MVQDHVLEEKAVERDAFRRIELLELLLGQHPVHLHRAPRRGVRGDLSVRPKPVLHDADLGHLRLVDLVGELEDPRVGPMRLGHPGHVDGLRVVGDHALHELDVGYGIDGALGDRDLAVTVPGH